MEEVVVVESDEVWVVGYYNRHNLGDDTFAHVFSDLIPKVCPGCVARIINADDVPLMLPPPAHVRAVIVGGGDVINDYFYKKLALLLESPNNRTCPVYAIGVGLPYPSAVEQGKLDVFDYIAHRSSATHGALLHRYGDRRHVELIPDLAWMLRTDNGPVPNTPPHGCFPWSKHSHVKERRIGVFLARPMHAGNEQTYTAIVNGIAVFLFSLATEYTRIGKRNQKTYHLEFVPFQTGPSVLDHENDTLMNEDVLTRMMFLNQGNALDNVTLVNQSPDVRDTLDLFRTYDFTVCSRFHAHVFSLMAGVPILSVSCTRKVDWLMRDAQLEEYVCRLPVDDKDRPLNCDANVLIAKFQQLLGREVRVREHIAHLGEISDLRMKRFRETLANLLYHLPQPVTRFVQSRTADKVSAFLAANHGPQGLNTDDRVVSCLDAPRNDTYKKKGAIAALQLSEYDTDRVVRLMSMLLVGKPVSEYSWGLRENLRSESFELGEACSWIFKHRLTESDKHRFHDFPTWKAETTVRGGRPTVDVEHVRGADISSAPPGTHRSGWDFVMSEVVKYHDPRAPVIFDGYLDETFGWRYEVLRDAGTIPFRRPWKGVLHHTPDQTSSDNNLVRMFARKAWRESLATCTGLITLSEHLADWVRRRLRMLRVYHVPVCSIMHPTEFLPRSALFSWSAFNRNVERKVVQVGGWLRNTFAIYDFPLWVLQCGYTKCALKGVGMDHYYLNDEQYVRFMKKQEELWDAIILSMAGGGGDVITGANQPAATPHAAAHGDDEVRDASPSSLIERGKVGDDVGYHYKPLVLNPRHASPWVIGARESTLRELDRKRASVTMIGHLENNDYDALLRANVVFLNLVDCSAVNTIVECIVRNTPLLVNALPAVVEYLGPAYPLYYTSLDHAAQLLVSEVALLQAHEYLKRMDKTFLKIDHFSNRFLAFLVNAAKAAASNEANK